MNCKCKVEQRRLTPGVFNLKQFLNGSETMVWEVDNCVINGGTCNLANYDAFLTLCVGGEIDEILLTKRQAGDKLQLIWNVGDYATALTGYVKYQISFRSAEFDTLGVIAEDPEANGVYTLTNQNATGNERVYQKADNGYSIKWDAENGRWALYQADGATVVDYQTTPNTEPHCGVWENIGVGNNEAAAWISDEAIIYVSDSIAADQKITGNYPTILRQLWKRISKSGVTSVNGQSGIVELTPDDIGAAEDEHQHEIKDIASLQETLNNKAAKGHTHTTADVTDLQAALNKKANASHAHKITDTEGLQDALEGKAPTDHGHVISNVTGLQDALNKKAPATHTEAKATTSVLGHVKVDGQTIVAEDGVIKAVGGMPIGSIFPFPASVPPEGAYLLNGQTIQNCKKLYPKFWQWLTENAGEMVAVPVYKAWTMPALTADGTAGGADYAVESSGAMSSGYEAYKAFDTVFGGSKTYASHSGQKEGYLTYYSPKKLKLTRVLFQNSTAGTAANRPISIVISGSNDNADWDELASVTYASTANSATQTEDIPESKYSDDNPGYQYFKFDFVNSGGSNIDVPEITLYGREYLYTDYTGNGNILTLSNEAYDYTLSRTGVCGGFVIDSTAGSVRLPTLINGTLWGANSSNIGQSLAAGLPNITANWKSEPSDDAHGAVSVAKESGNIQAVSTGGSDDSRLTFDASLSNPIYGNSDTVQPPAIRASWCIQVFNAATALSEQESAQLASEMQMKMQTNLANGSKATQTAVDNVMPDAMDYIIESWSADDGSGWYCKYRSGKVEQGGLSASVGSNTGLNVTLFVEMADDSYHVMVSSTYASTDDNYDKGLVAAYPETTAPTTMIYIKRARGSGTVYWEVKGKMAQ